MNRGTRLGAAIGALVLLIIVLSALFTVEQAEQAIVLQFGAPIRPVNQPGLHIKLPLIQTVSYFDKRVLDFDAESQEVPTLDQKQLVVDAFARYRILDPLLFYQTVNNERGVEARLGSIINSALRSGVSTVKSGTSPSTERRAELMIEPRRASTPRSLVTV